MTIRAIGRAKSHSSSAKSGHSTKRTPAGSFSTGLVSTGE
jgi:hypothetical protein